MRTKLIIVLKGEEETDYTVAADEWEIMAGTVLHIWRTGGAFGKFSEQWFVLANLSRWAWADP